MEEKIVSLLNSIDPEEIEKYSAYLMDRYQMYIRIAIILAFVFLVGAIIFYSIYRRAKKKRDDSIWHYIMLIICLIGIFCCILFIVAMFTDIRKLSKFPVLYSIYQCLGNIF